MKPFKLTLTLSTPVAINHPWLHLDGLLAHLSLLHQLGQDYYLLPTKEVVEVSYDTGLARIGEMFCGSISFFEPADMFSMRYYKRPEIRDFPGRRVDISRGHYRAWMLRHIYVAARVCMFHGRGDIETVWSLVYDLTHIGNDNRVGWGKIRDLRIEEMDEDWSVVREGRATRPIPVAYLRRWSDAVPLAWKPPYWAPGNVALCAPPGAEIELGDGCSLA